jgi:hypothetical protein
MATRSERDDRLETQEAYPTKTVSSERSQALKQGQDDWVEPSYPS